MQLVSIHVAMCLNTNKTKLQVCLKFVSSFIFIHKGPASTVTQHLCVKYNETYRQVSNIRRTLVGN